MDIKTLKARLASLQAKQAELAEAGNDADARALDVAIAEVRDMIVEAADDVEKVSDNLIEVGPSPKMAQVLNFRDAIKSGKEVEFTPVALSTETGTPGGNFVTEEWAEEYREAIFEADPLAGITDDIVTSTTENIPYVTDIGDDVVAVEGVDESITDTEIQAGTIQLGATTYSYSLFQTDEFIQDDKYNLESKFARYAGIAFGRRAFKLKVAAAKAATTAINKVMATKSSIGYDDIVDVIHALPAEYRRNLDALTFIISTEAATAIEKIKDTTGNPIMTGANSPLGATIKGIKFIESSELDALGTSGNVPMILMFNKGIIKADRGPITYKPLDKASGVRSIFKQRMDCKAAPIPGFVLAKCGASDPAA